MGNLEKEVRIEERKLKIQKMVLDIVAVAGILSVALLAPNALKIVGRIINKNKQRNFKKSLNTARRRLVNAGLLEYTENGFLRLTEKGENKLKQIELREYRVIKKPKRWDKKWRVLIFDIREEKKILREKVRNTLRQIGFVRLQDSVWVYPYDCEDLITLLKADFKIGKELLYLIVERIENDIWLKNFFEVS